MKPNKKQEKFLRAKKRYVAYGGARGGGKSWAVRIKATLLCVKYPSIRIMIVRRSYNELKENHILQLIQLTKGLATYVDSVKTLNFVNGSKIKFAYCDSESDVNRYQGMEFDVIFIDEATQLTEYQFVTLNACIRGVNDFPKRMYLTCNPGGVGHGWVKRLFIERRFYENENPDEYQFIPASVFDNDALLEKNADYLKTLEKLPVEIRKAWLYGDWDISSGQYFSEFDYSIHTVEEVEDLENMRIYASFDYGLDCFCNLFIGVNERNDIYVFDEIYEKNCIISHAVELTNAKNIKDVYCQIAPPDIWGRSQESGKSRADIFAENGLSLTKCGNDLKSGLIAIKELLNRTDNRPRLYIKRSCKNLIYSMTNILTEVSNPDVTANNPHELTHSIDALRYFANFYFYPKTERTTFNISSLREDIRIDYLNGDETIRKLIEQKYK